MTVFQWIFGKKWIYGTCNGRHARKHKRKGNVQFILWKAGEHNHKSDYWHDFGAGHEENFKPYLASTNKNDKNELS